LKKLTVRIEKSRMVPFMVSVPDDMFKQPRLFVIAALLCVQSALFAASTDCKKHHCIAIVDAGSTGSRAHIYSYDLDQTQSAVNVIEVWSKKIKPGLATIDANPSAVKSYLDTLFAEAPDSKMPLHFYATAGMRLLPQPQQKALYDLVQSWFAGQSRWDLKSARTISGKEEGLFGWVSLNYQQGALGNLAKAPSGVMDMGEPLFR
jgi:Golgi nucleoside diphosphatase